MTPAENFVPAKLLGGDPGITTAEGDPNPASFSRFVLPFAYRPVLRFDNANAMRDTYWVQAQELATPGVDRAERERYFTPEIALLFYTRAQRLRLAGFAQSALQFQAALFAGSEQSVTVCLRAPELLLFEWSAPKEPAEASDTVDLLQIGLLIVEAWFVDCDLPLASVMQFNELYRYVQSPFAAHNAAFGMGQVLHNEPLRNRFKSEHNDSKAVWPDRYQAQHQQDYLTPWLELLAKPVQLNGIWAGLFPKEMADNASKTTVAARSARAQAMIWPDTRAFVHACAVFPKDTDIATALGAKKASDLAEAPVWCKWLNVDGFRVSSVYDSALGMKRAKQPSEYSADLRFASEFEQNWSTERTYRRWLHFAALYGFSSHSAMMLTGFCDEPPTFQHFRSIYFDQSCLLLYIRSTLFRFSGEITRLASEIRDGSSAEQKAAQKKFRAMDADFALFVQLYQFPMLSNQQQGLEMYALQRRHMDIDELFKEVQDEIRHMHQTIDLQHDHDFRLIALGIGLVAILQLIQPLKDWLSAEVPNWWGPAAVCIFAVSALIAGLVYQAYFKKPRR